MTLDINKENNVLLLKAYAYLINDEMTFFKFISYHFSLDYIWQRGSYKDSISGIDITSTTCQHDAFKNHRTNRKRSDS